MMTKKAPEKAGRCGMMVDIRRVPALQQKRASVTNDDNVTRLKSAGAR
jgi:hypothetical protein